jgi:alkylhydroperoxidase family enzyme
VGERGEVHAEEQLVALVSLIALINAFNRGNVIARQPAGDYVVSGQPA